MASNRIDGLAETYSMFGRIPIEARHELADGMARIGREVLLAQKVDVAKRTGFLSHGLTLQLLIEELRVRVGLLNMRRGRSDRFYGRVVEYGRRAQTVLVTRHLKRTVRGNGRNGTTRRVAFEGSGYKMKVTALAARPFVHVDRPEIRAEQRLANFWAEVTARARGGA